MTTPERLRRRQRIEGTALLILGVFTIIISFYFRAEDASQRRCLADNFDRFSSALNQRGDLAARESRLSQRKDSRQDRRDNLTSTFINNVFLAKTPEQFQALGEKYKRDNERQRKAIRRINARIDKIQTDREKSPVPPFPKGACQ